MVTISTTTFFDRRTSLSIDNDMTEVTALRLPIPPHFFLCTVGSILILLVALKIAHPGFGQTELPITSTTTQVDVAQKGMIRRSKDMIRRADMIQAKTMIRKDMIRRSKDMIRRTDMIQAKTMIRKDMIRRSKDMIRRADMIQAKVMIRKDMLDVQA